MYRILSFPNQVEDGREYSYRPWANWPYPPDYDEYFEERRLQFSELGLIAAQLASDLRTAYRYSTAQFQLNQEID